MTQNVWPFKDPRATSYKMMGKSGFVIAGVIVLCLQHGVESVRGPGRRNITGLWSSIERDFSFFQYQLTRAFGNQSDPKITLRRFSGEGSRRRPGPLIETVSLVIEGSRSFVHISPSQRSSCIS